MALLPFTPSVFAILSGLVEEHSGVHYAPVDADIFMDKVALRAIERGFDSLLDYYYFLRYDEAGKVELDTLLESIVVNETYFFRELRPLVALVDLVLAPAIASGRRPRVWSAAASTGEEPLTIAMLLAERGLLGQVELHATDISERALAQARRGDYGGRSLRSIPPGYERWLRLRQDRATVAPELVAAIRWGRANLNDLDTAPPGSFDAILCRNVLIYFTLPTARKVVDALTQRLVHRGVLLVGVSESLLSMGTSLRCEERGGAFFYEKVIS